MTTKFKEGKKYYGRSLVDHDTKIIVKILKRTPTTVTIKMDPKNGWPTDQTRFRIKTSAIGGVTREYIRLGRYSLAPIILYRITYKCVISSARDGVTGKMVYFAAGKVSDMYYEIQDLAKMRRIKVSELPKTLAEYTKNLRKKSRK